MINLLYGNETNALISNYKAKKRKKLEQKKVANKRTKWMNFSIYNTCTSTCLNYLIY